MKTIVFHSYKGGVGRSLALANLAFALSALGKRVVVMDLDIDAPGLHSKLALAGGMEGWESRVRGGYIDYLAYFFDVPFQTSGNDKPVVDHKPRAAGKTARCKYLNEACVLNINDNLKFIPAGKYDQKYWWNLASPWFNELFSISRNEYSSRGTVRLHHKREFLRDEKKVIAGLFAEETDYFLVDCKSAREYSSVPLYYWADAIVSMFPANQEGIEGAARVHQFVLSVREGEKVKIVPVACRLPGDVDFSEAKSSYYARVEHFLSQHHPVDRSSDSKVDDSIFVRLREHKLLEHSERILTFGRSEHPQATWYHGLLMDYVDLFAQLFDIDDCIPADGNQKAGLALNSKTDWMSYLKMHPFMSMDDGIFQIKPYLGILENKDSQRNVLLRASSLRILIESMAKAIPDEDKRKESLVGVGRIMGSSFGAEFSERFFRDKPIAFHEKLQVWCSYDSQNAGFGVLSPIFTDRNITISWKRNFVDEDYVDENPDIRPRGEDKIGYFLLQGYVEGVIARLAERIDPPEIDKGETHLDKFGLGTITFNRREPDLVDFVFTPTEGLDLLLSGTEEPSAPEQVNDDNR